MKCGMSLLKLTLNVSLLFGINLFISEISGKDIDIVNGDDLIKPINYEIKFTFDERHQQEKCAIYLSGECNIKILINFLTDRITLHAQKPYVNIISANMFDMMESEYFVRDIIHDNVTHSLDVYFEKNLYGNFTLKLRFSNCANNEEVFKTSYMEKTGHRMLLFATHLRPTRARALFPCWDDPRIMATFRIIVTLDTKYQVLSNTPMHSYENNMALFHQTSRMSTHDIAIVIFDKHFLSRYISYVSCRSEVTKYLGFAHTIVQYVTQHLKTKDSFREHIDVDHVVIPGFPHNAMSKSGLNIFREEAILYDVKMNPFGTKVEVARLVARVMAHERLNNMISPIWLSYLWLNEGIAMLLGQDAVNDIFPDLRMFDLFVVQFHQESLHLDINPIMGPIMPRVSNGTHVNTLFSFSHYIKGPVILYMIQRQLTSEVFWKGINIYLTKPITPPDEVRAASFDDFISAMTNVASESWEMPMNNLVIKKVINVWVKQTHYPVVYAIRTDSSHVEITLKNYNEVDPESLWLPITIITQSNLTLNHGNWVKDKGMLNKSTTYLIRNAIEGDWILVNLQQNGYYRVHYDEENWRKLARYLNSDNYANIHVLNRAQIMDDAFHFLNTEQIDYSIFSQLISYLSRETDYIAWYPVIKNFEYMSNYFLYEESVIIKMRFHVLLDSLIQKIGHEENFDNINIVNCLRQEALKWACVLGSSYCNEIAKSSLESGIHATRILILPWKKDWMYCAGMMKAEYNTWRKMFDIFLNEIDNKMLKYLACSKDTNVILDYIYLIKNNEEIKYRIKNKEIEIFINIFHSIIEKHAKNTLVLEYILENFSRVIPSQIGTIVAFTDIINHIYTSIHLKKLMLFLMTNKVPNVLLFAHKICIRKDQIYKQRKPLQMLFERFTKVY